MKIEKCKLAERRKLILNPQCVRSCSLLAVRALAQRSCSLDKASDYLARAAGASIARRRSMLSTVYSNHGMNISSQLCSAQ
jgi:hypothetical protein